MKIIFQSFGYAFGLQCAAFYLLTFYFIISLISRMDTLIFDHKFKENLMKMKLSSICNLHDLMLKYIYFKCFLLSYIKVRHGEEHW